MYSAPAGEAGRLPALLEPRPGDVLIVVDVQNDFLSGGTLPARNGSEIIAPLNRVIAAFHRRALPIYATRDWHPTYHRSFRLQGGPWRPHCIAGLRGAEPPAALDLPAEAHVIRKGTSEYADGYSGFQATGLGVELRRAGCQRVFVGGLASDYCVRATALDALRNGFEAVVLEDAVRPLEVHDGDGQRALDEMRAAGVTLASSGQLAH